jgi:hypothetical protein
MYLNLKAEKGSVDLRKAEKLIEALNRQVNRDVLLAKMR